VTRAPTDRSHLSIGEVLSLLQEEFPDITISKIRFLESQGLLDPERTPSGYRKFYEADIDRLRWILQQQKDHYLPLKVIKDRLDETGPVRTAPTATTPADVDPVDGADPAPVPAPAMAATTSPARSPARPGDRRNGLSAVALDERPTPSSRSAPPRSPAPPPAPQARVAERRPVETERGLADVADVIEAPAPRPVAAPPAADPTLRLSPTQPSSPETRSTGASRQRTRTGGRSGAAPDVGAVSFTADELSQASGLSARAVRELEGYGLLESYTVGDTSYYDADALIIARTAAGFLEHGIEARHIRSYKVAVEREAGLFEQIVLPLLKQRNPEAKRRATQTIAELMRLGDEMRGVLLRRGLRDHIPPA
jgi:DNA-binding transcriptional MerR regulator